MIFSFFSLVDMLLRIMVDCARTQVNSHLVCLRANDHFEIPHFLFLRVVTLRRFTTRFSCSFLLQLLASCASERVQHHGAHPWIRGKSKQKRPKAILKNRHFLIKGVVWPRSCIEKPLPKLAAETKRPQQPKRFNSASPKSVANVFKAKKPLRQNVRKLMSAMVGQHGPAQRR